jgi:hypothetical protein
MLFHDLTIKSPNLTIFDKISAKTTSIIIIIIIKFVTNVKTLQQYNTTVYDMCDRNKEQNFHPN